MSLTAAQKRLAKLEAQRPVCLDADAYADGIHTLITTLIAVYLGELQPSEAIGTGFERALACGQGCDLDARYRDAVDRLLALRAVTFDHDGNGVMCALKALHENMPEARRQRLRLEGFDAAAFFTDVPDSPTFGRERPHARLGTISVEEAVMAHRYAATLDPNALSPPVAGKSLIAIAAEYEATLRQT